jgi:hypothetical protein
VGILESHQAPLLTTVKSHAPCSVSVPANEIGRLLRCCVFKPPDTRLHSSYKSPALVGFRPQISAWMSADEPMMRSYNPRFCPRLSLFCCGLSRGTRCLVSQRVLRRKQIKRRRVATLSSRPHRGHFGGCCRGDTRYWARITQSVGTHTVEATRTPINSRNERVLPWYGGNSGGTGHCRS